MEVQPVDAVDRTGPTCQQRGQFVERESRGNDGGGAESGPTLDVASDHEDRAAGHRRPADELTVEAHGAMVDQQGRERPAGVEPIEQVGDPGAGQELVAAPQVGEAQVDGGHPGRGAGGQAEEDVAVVAARAADGAHRRESSGRPVALIGAGR